MTASQLFDYMIADFGIACKSRTRSHVLFKLHQWLLDRYQAGEQTVLVVDEAQILSRQTLEEIRLLTNLETSTEKLLQIVLAGQPEIEQKLNQRELRQLRQRIALRAKTLPLTPEETRGYILERLRIAGSNGEEIFSSAGDRGGAPARARNPARDQSALRASAGQSVCASSGNPFRRKSSRTLRAISAWTRWTCWRSPSRAAAAVRRNGRSRKHSSRGAPRAPEAPPKAATAKRPPPFGITQIKLPLFVYGYGADGDPFYEHAHTIATNARGGLISMNTPVQPGQRLLITNKENECSQECVVEFLGRTPGARRGRGI